MIIDEKNRTGHELSFYLSIYKMLGGDHFTGNSDHKIIIKTIYLLIHCILYIHPELKKKTFTKREIKLIIRIFENIFFCLKTYTLRSKVKSQS